MSYDTMFRPLLDCNLLIVVTLLSISQLLCTPAEKRYSEDASNLQYSDEEQEFSPDRIKEAEKHFMSLLGLKKKPRKRRGLHVPEHIWKLYHSWSNNDASDMRTNLVRVLHQTTGTNEAPENSVANQELIRFDLMRLPLHEKIRKAELHFYRRPSFINTANVPHTARQASVKLFYSWRSGHPCKKRKRKHDGLIAWRKIDLLSSTWDVFNVTRAVKKWTKRPRCLEGLILRVYRNGSDVSKMIETFVGQNHHNQTEFDSFRPFLLLHFDDGSGERRKVFPPHSASRVRRYVDNDPELPVGEHRVYNLHQAAKRETCRRRQMYLNFGAVGWNEYIIAPAGYDVYFCGGICPKPLGPHLNTTNHAVIQNQVNSFDPNLAPPPCCVPTLLGDVTILFLNEHYQITLKNYKNMVALGCGCR